MPNSFRAFSRMKTPIVLAAVIAVAGCSTLSTFQSGTKGARGGEVNGIASAIQSTSPTSREKTVSWPQTFSATNSFGDLATQIRGLRLSIIEQKNSQGNLETGTVVSWEYHNFSQDDRNNSTLAMTFKFYSVGGQLLETYTRGSPRNHCSYDGFRAKTETMPLKNNYIDIIGRVTFEWSYGASYEGRC